MNTSLKQRWQLLGVAVLLLSIAFAHPAAGQEDDPYGSTTTTTQPPGQTPSCRLRDGSASPGETVRVTVKAVPRGDTVRLLFDGEEQARTVAGGPGNSQRVNVDMAFVVPADASEGTHEVVAVGSHFSAQCVTSQGKHLEVEGGEVLGEQHRNSRGLPRTIGGLPRTGVYAALLVAIAAALVLAGRHLVAESRRRHAREAEQALERARRRRATSSI